MSTLKSLFKVQKPIIGMLHSMPLPGSPNFKKYTLEEVYDYGIREAKKLKDGGVDAILIENAGDIPFVRHADLGPETASCIAVLGHRVREETGLPIGINIVANAIIDSIAAAKACGAKFVRCNQWANAYIANEGFVEGPAGIALRYRSMLEAEDIHIFADVHVKHGSHAIIADRSIEEQSRDVEFYEASVLIATGFRTGHNTSISEVEGIKKGATIPVLVGSGIDINNCEELFKVADGAILGVSIKEQPMMSSKIDIKKLKIFMDNVKRIREK